MRSKPSTETVNLMSKKFISLNNSYELSQLLGYDYNSFRYLILKAGYHEFSIRKASGGKRIIEAPNPGLLSIQRSLNEYLQTVYLKLKPSSAFGFIKAVRDTDYTYSIVSNARKHTSRNFVLNIDMLDFFHSISAVRVKEIFLGSPFYFPNDLATCIALISCRNGRLPMGAASSPVISNLACLGLDKKLMSLAEKNGLAFTRYADDLTFSSDIIISDEVVEQIKSLVTESGFEINKRKFRLQSKFRQQTVTGIKVNVKANVDRRYVKSIRALLHDIKCNGVEKAAAKHYKVAEADERLTNRLRLSIRGKVNFIGEVRGKSDLVYNRLRQELNFNLGMINS
jgi:RNA-directed DNA polymerase